MGKYINHTSNGKVLPAKGKAEFLIANGATEVEPKWQPNLICVVDNGPFEAAAYAYSEAEFTEFNTPDGRRKRWLIHPQAERLIY